MTTRFRKTAIVGWVACAAALTLPAAAWAESGGLGFDGGGLPATDGSELIAPAGVMLGKTAEVSGTLSGVHKGDLIEIQRSNPNGEWTVLTTATAGASGGFTAIWKPTASERLQLRAVPAGAASFRSANTIPTRPIAIFPRTTATWFGPGFYGKRTYCGNRMTRGLLGVAHKKLPCGARVEVFHNGRSVTVPVVDRGPFHKKIEYDLTAATAKRLRFKHAGKIGALPVDTVAVPASRSK